MQQSQRAFEAAIYGSWRSTPDKISPKPDSAATPPFESPVVIFSGADLLAAARDRTVDVYGTHLRVMLQHCQDVHTVSAAFDAEELSLIRHLLQLPCASLALLHRLHSRKAAWFTLADITKRYFQPQAGGDTSEPPALKRATAVLSQLVANGSLLPLPSSEAPPTPTAAPPAAGTAALTQDSVLSTVFEGLPHWLVAVLQFLCTSASRLVLNGVAAQLGVRSGGAGGGKRRLTPPPPCTPSNATPEKASKGSPPIQHTGGPMHLAGKLALSHRVLPAAVSAAGTACTGESAAMGGEQMEAEHESDDESRHFMSVDALDAAAAARGAGGGDSKAALVRQLVHAVMAQRTVFGQFLPIASATHSTLLELLQKSSAYSDFTSGSFEAPLAVRLPPPLQLLLLKAHRVFYITTVQSSHTESALSWSSSWDGHGGAGAWARCSNALTSMLVHNLSAEGLGGSAPGSGPARLAKLVAHASSILCDARVDVPPHLGLLSGKLLRRATGTIPSAAVSPPPSTASWRSVPSSRVLALLQALGTSSVATQTMSDGSGGFSPGLLHVFHKMDFVPYTCTVQQQLFGEPAHFRILQACEQLSFDHIVARMISRPVKLEHVPLASHGGTPAAASPPAAYFEDADGTLVLSDSDEDSTEADESAEMGSQDLEHCDSVAACTPVACGQVFGAHFAAAIWDNLVGAPPLAPDTADTSDQKDFEQILTALFSCPTPHHSPGLELLSLVVTACVEVSEQQACQDQQGTHDIQMPELTGDIRLEMQEILQVALVYPSLLFVLRLSTCLHLYSAWQLCTTKESDWLHKVLRNPDTTNDFAEHAHLFLLEPQQKIAYVLWESLDSLNRIGLHHHSVPFLRQLIAIPFVRHRNGRMWARLTINLAHIGLMPDAALAAWEGLQDPAVVGGDRVYLQRKWRKQQQLLHEADSPVAAGGNWTNVARKDSTSFGCNADAAMLPAWVAAELLRTCSEQGVSTAPLLVNDRCKHSVVVAKHDIVAVEFEHRPLNRTVGEKSRFLGFDTNNDLHASCQDGTEDCSEASGVNSPIGKHHAALPHYCRNWGPALAARGGERADGGVQFDGLFGCKSEQTVPPGDDKAAGSTPDKPAGRCQVAAGFSAALLFRMMVAEAQWEHSVAPSVVAGHAEHGTAALDSLFSTWPVLRHKGGAAVLHGIAMHISASAGRPSAWRKGAAPSAADTESPPAAAEKGTPDMVGFTSHFPVSAAAAAASSVELASIAALPLLAEGAPWDKGFASWNSKVHAARQMGVSVEHLCIGEYATAGGWMGMHVEGGPLMTLAALFCFEVVFSLEWDSEADRFEPTAALPDVFLTPYQDCPLDMAAGGIFAQRRRSAIAALLRRLKQASSWDLATWLAATYCRTYGYLIRNVNWKRYPLCLLQLIAIGMGGNGLAALCGCYLSDPSHFTAGLPDLLLWRATLRGTATAPLPRADPTENSTVPVDRLQVASREIPALFQTSTSTVAAAPAASGEVTPPSWPKDVPLFCPPCIWELLPQPLSAVHIEVCLSEVKGPRDTLSDKQRTWLSALAAAGCAVHLCKVKEPPPEPKHKRTAAKRKRQGSAAKQLPTK